MSLLSTWAKLPTPSGQIAKTFEQGMHGGFEIKEDPFLKALNEKSHGVASEMENEANTYQSQAPELKTKQTNIATDQLKTGLAKDMLSNTQNANQRGLLYSGLKQKGEQQAQSKFGTNVVKAKTDISQTIDDKAREMQQQALQAQIQAAQIDQMEKEDAWRQAMAARSGAVGNMSPLAGGLFNSFTA